MKTRFQIHKVFFVMYLIRKKTSFFHMKKTPLFRLVPYDWLFALPRFPSCSFINHASLLSTLGKPVGGQAGETLRLRKRERVV